MRSLLSSLGGPPRPPEQARPVIFQQHVRQYRLRPSSMRPVARHLPGARACPLGHSYTAGRRAVPRCMRRDPRRKQHHSGMAASAGTGKGQGSTELQADPEAQQLLKGPRKPFAGLKPTPELTAIAMVYFVQGILGLARLAVTFLLKDDFKLEPATVALLTGFAGIPWLVKPFYGFLSDSVPLFGYRRRSYLIACGAVGALSWTCMATVVHGPAGAVAAVMLGSLSTAFSDVVVDSIVVERARGGPQELAGSLQSLCWASSAVGGVTSAYFSGSLVPVIGPRGVFALTAIFPLAVSLSALLITEDRVQLGSGHLQGVGAGIAQRFREQGRTLWGALSTRSILLPSIFVFLWQATPSADTAFFYFQTNKLGFDAEFLGRVRLVASLASLAGVATFNFFLKPVPLRKIFFWTSIIGTLLGLSQLLLITGVNRSLGLSDELFALGDTLVLTVLGQVAFMPILVLAAQLCPEGVEATLFATLMSILNAGGFVGGALGSLLTAAFGVTSTDFSRLAPLVIVCTLSSLAPLPLLRLVPDTRAQDESAVKDDL